MSSPASDDPGDFIDNDEAGLFGESDEEIQNERRLSDRELDSGDDEGRSDRAGDDVEAEAGLDADDRKANIMAVAIPRFPIPIASDDQLYTLRMPKFISLDPKPFDASNFKPPTSDHHTDGKNAEFSANQVANSTIRFRTNLQSKELESNTVINRWSDGSTTLAIGDNVYELVSKPLAPSAKDLKGYQEVLDSHQYIASYHDTAQVIHILGHVMAQYTVRPNKEIEDAALEKLQSSMAAATRGRNKNDIKDGIALISSNLDPELQKKQAELAEKERAKAQRRRENAAARADQQIGRVRSAMGGGLSLDDLEGRSRVPGSRKKRSAPSGPRRARRRHDYDTDDEEDAPRGGRQDEYDLEDDFLVASDEEQEAYGGESDEEEEEEEAEDSPRPKKLKTSNDKDSADGSDLDAEGEEDDVPQLAAATGDAAGGRGRNRNIIEDDDDE